MILELNGLYREGDFSLSSGYFYVSCVTNISQCWALYCLALFYYATKNELAPIRPIGKFLSVKMLVFFTWWQSLFISILYYLKLIPHYGELQWTEEDVAKAIQAYLICVEMFGAAVLHVFVFPHTEFGRERNEILLMRYRKENNNRVRLLGRHGKKYLGFSLRKDSNESLSSIGKPDTSKTKTRNNGESQSSNLTDSHKLHMSESSQNGSQDQQHKDTEMCPLNDRLSEPRVESTHVECNHEINNNSSQLPFVKAFLDSVVPRDVFDESIGIVKGQYSTKKKTLLHHAATSDEYDIFDITRKRLLNGSSAGVTTTNDKKVAYSRRKKRDSMGNSPSGKTIRDANSKNNICYRNENVQSLRTRRNVLLNDSGNAVAMPPPMA
eukprot:CAMPEP_0171323790 /NCGR_PEP_ID=MMETSP0816-20121228/115796_1 /TAXON_ID=420281 /ORGANISM="Proboscia inermis, Strain CCAP1064/1" /LENGTH=380 /DNA_ID=CAMNT_0011822593 /DNA_START=1969 /DNA_END=3111 /DNA_ORIENTATION=-